MNISKSIGLIGLPGSGKTKLAKLVGEKIQINPIDTDDLILSKIKMPISLYFEKFGESDFRKIESSVIDEIIKDSKNNFKLVSFGGGAPIYNQEKIKDYFDCIYIDRPLKSIHKTLNDKRPLAKNLDDLKSLDNKRRDIYKNIAKYHIIHTSLKTSVQKILDIISL